MKRISEIAVVACCLGLVTGCSTGQPSTFTFTADLPPNFAYKAIAEYVPAKGETCTVQGGRNTAVGYNLKWRESYTPNSEIAMYRTVSGCPLVISRIKLEINSSYGKERGDFGGDFATVVIPNELDEKYKAASTKLARVFFMANASGYFAPQANLASSAKFLTASLLMQKASWTEVIPFRLTPSISFRVRP